MKGTMADRHYANRHNSARLRGWADENHLPFSSQNAIFYNNTIDLIWFLNALYFYFKHMYWKIIMSNHFFVRKSFDCKHSKLKLGKKTCLDLSIVIGEWNEYTVLRVTLFSHKSDSTFTNVYSSIQQSSSPSFFIHFATINKIFQNFNFIWGT